MIKSIYECWVESDADTEKYKKLLIENGHLVRRKPGEEPKPLPCGWKPTPRARRSR